MNGKGFYMQMRTGCFLVSLVSLGAWETAAQGETIEYVYNRDGILRHVSIDTANPGANEPRPLNTGYRCYDFRHSGNRVLGIEAEIKANKSRYVWHLWDLKEGSHRTLEPPIPWSIYYLNTVYMPPAWEHAIVSFVVDKSTSRLATVDLKTGKMDLLAAYEGYLLCGALSRDEKTLYGLVEKDTNRPVSHNASLCAIDIESGRARKLVDHVYVFSTDSSPGGVCLSPDGKTVLVAAVCYSDAARVNRLGYITLTNESKNLRLVVEPPHFSGWLDDEYFLAREGGRINRLWRYDLEGKRQLLQYDMNIACMLPGTKYLMIGPSARDPDFLSKMELWSIDGRKLGDLPKDMKFPFEMWRY